MILSAQYILKIQIKVIYMSRLTIILAHFLMLNHHNLLLAQLCTLIYLKGMGYVQILVLVDGMFVMILNIQDMKMMSYNGSVALLQKI
ncbi:hypothetical protein AB894_03715 [Piscirickettsia salmonis]|nr:hypothetical protein AB894_03715 [Piscirickettsia salmonis]